MGDRAARALVRDRRADRLDIALGGAAVAWTTAGAGNGAGRSGPMVAVVVAGAAALALGRWAASRDWRCTHRMITVGVAGTFVLTAPGLLHAGGPPLEYANANATLGGLGALAALAATASERPGSRRRAWAATTAALVIAVILTRSVAGAGSLTVVAALLALGAATRRAVVVLQGGAVVVVMVLGITTAIARGADPAQLLERNPERQALWAAAVDLAGDHPLRGVGPGEFARAQTVATDADLRWAHQEYLQAAAETGLVGLGLLLAIIGWCYARLALSAVRAPGRAMIGGAALTLVALHSTVDHVLHDPAVVLLLAAIIGAATAGDVASRVTSHPS